MSGVIFDEEGRRKRLGLKPDESDINRRLLAVKVLTDDTLENHERLLIARLLDPELVAAVTKRKKGRGRPVANATALKADRIAEEYFTLRAMGLRRKHKDACASAGDYFGVSGSRVDKVLGALEPARRAELERDAAALAKRFAEWEASPAGIARAAGHGAFVEKAKRERPAQYAAYMKLTRDYDRRRACRRRRR